MKRLALMFAAASLAAPLSAQSVPEEPRSITISTAGVRFDNAESVARLRARIARAVRQVCAPAGSTLRDHMLSRQCRIEAKQRSDQQLAELLSTTRLAALQ